MTGALSSRLLALALMLAALPLCAAAAELATVSSDALRPGRYAWSDGPDAGPVRIVIDRARQLAYVYRGETLVGLSTVSTGKQGKRTPLGTFTILQKAARHRSNKYSNAPMPFMQRLTWDGIALHAGHLPGYPASHGCIRLPWAFAQKLFGMTALGATVEITDGGPPLPRIRMAEARPVTPALPVAPASIDASAEPLAIELALATPAPPRPPRASWQEQAAEDYVTWGSVLPRRDPPVGLPERSAQPSSPATAAALAA